MHGNDNFQYEASPDYGGSSSWLTPLLRQEETVLWQGRPLPGKWFHRQDFYLIPFCVIWCGFAVFWEFSAIKDGHLFLILWGIPFVAVGLYMVFGRFFYQQAVKRKTRYAATTHRIIVQSRNQLTFLTYRQIPIISRALNRDGSGTICFGPRQTYLSIRPRLVYPSIGPQRENTQQPAVTCFEDIADAERVYRIIEEQMLERV